MTEALDENVENTQAVNIGSLLEPPEIVKRTGYNLMKARVLWSEDYGDYGSDDYLVNAYNGIMEARDYFVDQGIGYAMEASEALSLLAGALHARFQIRSGAQMDIYRKEQPEHDIGRAHNCLRLLLEQYGYRPLTARDMAEFGAGGSR